MPVVVIGGGRDAIDAATEAMAYYPVQVENSSLAMETLIAEHGDIVVRSIWSEAEAEIADEFIHHAQAIRAERKAAHARGQSPRLPN